MSELKLYIISGTSGSGKTIALQVLEDLGYYCIDNLPASLIPEFANKMVSKAQSCAISIDSRNQDFIDDFDMGFKHLDQHKIKKRLVFLDADDATLLKRYSETRRKHPLSDEQTSLSEAIAKERALLSNIADQADRRINTSLQTPHELRTLMREDSGSIGGRTCTLLLQSFGFKYGSPLDADFVFDVRCLPNPHWEPNLKSLNGTDQEVIKFLEQEPDCELMSEHIRSFVATWIPKFIADNRNYITIAIGCTGGQHRSVYLVEKLNQYFTDPEQPLSDALQIITRHREIGIQANV
ncbi:MAG: RNase adapter RapZ [Pseudomonadota bacterium]